MHKNCALLLNNPKYVQTWTNVQINGPHGSGLVDTDVFFDGFLQLFLDFRLRLTKDVLDDGFSGFGISANRVPALPTTILAFSDVALAVCSSLWHGISLETQQPIANRYVIASHISNDAAVSYHSAFEFYGYSNQVFYETQVTSESRFRDFEYDGVTYRRIAPRITGGITEINGTRVTTLERTVIDSINLFEKIGGLEELLRCLALIPTLDEAALSACLAEYESGFLYQKTGYILSAFAASLGLSDSFFAKCKSHLPKGKSYLSSESQGFIWHEEWKLYAPNTYALRQPPTISIRPGTKSCRAM